MLHHYILSNQRVTLGGGKEVSMKYYSVESLKFENLEVKNIIFGVLDQQTENSKCILGMDFFENKFSKFDPDFDNQKIYLEK